MNLPMAGQWRVLVHGVRPFTIHGDEYVELHVEPLDPKMPGSVLALRISSHAISDEGVAVGQTVDVRFLLGQVTSVVTTA